MTSEGLLNAQSRPRILIVDDDPAIRRLLRTTLQQDYTLEEASTGDKALDILAKLAESRDQDTGGHLARIRVYAQTIAEHLAADSIYAKQIDRQFLEDLKRASPLHDIGKVGIPGDILLKTGPLTKEEFAVMKLHTVIGADILDQAVAQTNGGGGFLAMAALVARFHHERYDGTGYPNALVGQEIPLPARIVALVDAYDAITSERPYKPADFPSRARELIQRDSGRHFDPAVVAAFDAVFPAFLTIQQNVMDDLPTVQLPTPDSVASTS